MAKIIILANLLILTTFLATEHVYTQIQKSGESVPKRISVVGEVEKIDPSSRQLQLRKADGTQSIVRYDQTTTFSRVAPGARSLEGALNISPSEISMGDRLYAQSVATSPENKDFVAETVVLMSRVEILRKQQREKEEWRRRGIAGRVDSISPSENQLTLIVPEKQGGRKIIAQIDPKRAQIRRYAAESVRFEDSLPSSITDIKVGDLVRTLGTPSADGDYFVSEDIISGSFRTVAGTVTAINAGDNTVHIKTLPDEKPVKINLSSRSMIRHVPNEVASAILEQVLRNAGLPNTPERKPSVEADAKGKVRKSIDLPEGIENAPERRPSEIRPGQMALITTSDPIGSSQIRAAIFLTGVETVLGLFKPKATAKPGSRKGLNTGIPLSALDGIGIQ